MILAGCTISGGRKGRSRGLQGCVVSDREAPIVGHVFRLAVFRSRATIPSRLAISCLLLLCATSQPLLTQSAKLTLVSNHKKFLFLRHGEKKVILGRELFVKLA